uniref:Uncharacterized protein n=1 Tax=Arion vulgaris TaxID=1028688 RepID=A0A0B7AQH3_9EUPU
MISTEMDLLANAQSPLDVPNFQLPATESLATCHIALSINLVDRGYTLLYH